MLIGELEEQIRENGGAVFAVNKSKGITSQKAVQIVKYWARSVTGNKKIKVGHGGTLDPLATGVLVIAVGRAFTKKIDEHVAAQKEYVAHIALGEISATDDAEGEKEVIKVDDAPDDQVIRQTLELFVGDIEQIPPAYSAIKIDGQEAYKRVRRGEEVLMQARLVHIDQIELLSYNYPTLEIRVECGKGTYIRSLARDLGTKLHTGAYLSDLKRTRVGDFKLSDTLSLTDLHA